MLSQAEIQRELHTAMTLSDEVQADSKDKWYLIWCHERCYKEDFDAVRSDLAKVVEEIGGSLVCLKKASGFGRWVAREQHPPFVLLTDWREAKPCMSIVSQSRVNTPRLAAVYTEQERQFRQASQWASSMPGQGVCIPVQVLAGSHGMSDFVDLVSKVVHCNEELLRLPKVSRPRLELEPLLRDDRPEPWQPTSEVALPFPETQQVSPRPSSSASSTVGCSPPGVWSLVVTETGKWAVPVSSARGKTWQVTPEAGMRERPDEAVFRRLRDKTQEDFERPPNGSLASPLGGLSPSSFCATEAGKWAEPVAQLLVNIFPRESLAEVKEVLSVAMPKQYED